MYQGYFQSSGTGRWVRRCSRAVTCSAQSNLSQVGIVLVSPKNPENIGSVLRVSGNFGIGKVVLVNPRCSFESETGVDKLAQDTITTVACNSPLLGSLDVTDTLHNALGEAKISICFTRRSGKGRVTETFHSFLSANESLGIGASHDDHGSSPSIMLVFGREEHGLFQEEIQACSHALEIPSNPDFPSLNLSHAVAVVVSRLYEWNLQSSGTNDSVGRELADHAEVNALLSRVTRVLTGLGLDTVETRGGGDQGNHGRRMQPLGHLRSLLMRSRATTQEVRSLFGLVKSVEQAIDDGPTRPVE